MKSPSNDERRGVNSPVLQCERRRVSPPGRAALLTALVVGVGCAAAQAPDAKKEPAQELHISLKGNHDNHEGWQLVGPAALECVHFEPEGMRIVLPAGHPGERANTGLKISAAAKGDFEITVSFEILKEPDEAEAGKRATALKLIAHVDSPHKHLVGFSRRVAAGEGPQFTTWLNVKNPQAKKPQTVFRTFATDAMKGRLRLVRTGADIAYYVAKDAAAEFTFLHQFPFGEEDLRAVSLVGSTGGPQAAFDVRFTDLRVRAGSVSQATPITPDNAAGSSRLIALAAALVIAVIVAGAWRYLRRNSRAGTKPPVVTGTKGNEP